MEGEGREGEGGYMSALRAYYSDRTQADGGLPGRCQGFQMNVRDVTSAYIVESER